LNGYKQIALRDGHPRRLNPPLRNAPRNFPSDLFGHGEASQRLAAPVASEAASNLVRLSIPILDLVNFYADSAGGDIDWPGAPLSLA
jgi:hypothetical protein